jgi:hypothetical protein
MIVDEVNTLCAYLLEPPTSLPLASETSRCNFNHFIPDPDWIEDNRVVHGSPFWLLFDSFSLSLFTHFSRMRRENELKMKLKRRLFAKWATPPHFVNCLLFRGFSTSFSISFSLHNLNSAFYCHCTMHHRDPCSSPTRFCQPPQQRPVVMATANKHHLQPPLPQCHP